MAGKTRLQVPADTKVVMPKYPGGAAPKGVPSGGAGGIGGGRTTRATSLGAGCSNAVSRVVKLPLGKVPVVEEDWLRSTGPDQWSEWCTGRCTGPIVFP